MSGSRGVKRSEKTVDFYFMLKIRKKLIKKKFYKQKGLNFVD